MSSSGEKSKKTNLFLIDGHIFTKDEVNNGLLVSSSKPLICGTCGGKIIRNYSCRKCQQIIDNSSVVRNNMMVNDWEQGRFTFLENNSWNDDFSTIEKSRLKLEPSTVQRPKSSAAIVSHRYFEFISVGPRTMDGSYRLDSRQKVASIEERIWFHNTHLDKILNSSLKGKLPPMKLQHE